MQACRGCFHQSLISGCSPETLRHCSEIWRHGGRRDLSPPAQTLRRATGEPYPGAPTSLSPSWCLGGGQDLETREE